MEVEKVRKRVEEALGGSQPAFNALLSAYWPDVYAFLSAYKLCPEDTEDLCIETFSKAFEKLDTYDPSYRFKTWVLHIARNNYVDFIRRNAPLCNHILQQELSKRGTADVAVADE